MARRTFTLRFAAAAAAALIAGACTVKKQETPALTGPSELGTSISISVSPDVLTQDGASQSIVTITARDNNGQPLRNLTLRTETFVGGTRVDFGSLSARSVVTDANGRATVVFTAPPSANGAVGVDNGTVVNIAATPVGNDFANATPRFAQIRLVPPGVVVPADGLNPSFTVTPTAPLENDVVFFQACVDTTNPCAPANNPIVSFNWDLGGQSASGPTATRTFTTAGNYIITLTVTDAFGRTASTQRQIVVGAGARPTAAFTFSPNPTQLNQPTHFNASGSAPSAGRTILAYNWDFGDGTQTTTGSPLVDHVYTLPRTFVVTLTVTDNTGKVSAPTSVNVTPQ